MKLEEISRMLMKLVDYRDNLIKRSFETVEDFADDMSMRVEDLLKLKIPLKRQAFSISDIDKFRRSNIGYLEHCSRRFLSENITLFTRLKRNGLLPSWIVLDVEYDNGQDIGDVSSVLYKILYDGTFVGHHTIYDFVKRLTFQERVTLSLHYYRKTYQLVSGLKPDEDVLLDSFLTGCPGFIVGDIVNGIYAKNIKIVYAKFMEFISKNSLLKDISAKEEKIVLTTIVSLSTDHVDLVPPQEVERVSEMISAIPTQHLVNKQGLDLICGTMLAKKNQFYDLVEQMEFPGARRSEEEEQVEAILAIQHEATKVYLLNSSMTEEEKIKKMEQQMATESVEEEDRYRICPEDFLSSIQDYILGSDYWSRRSQIYYRSEFWLCDEKGDRIVMLPRDPLARIFSYLRPLSRFQLRRVCKSFYNAVFDSLKEYNDTVFDHYRNLFKMRTLPYKMYDIKTSEGEMGFMKTMSVYEDVYAFCRYVLVDSFGSTPRPMVNYIIKDIGIPNTLLLLMGVFEELVEATYVTYRYYYWLDFFCKLMDDYKYATLLLALQYNCHHLATFQFENICTYYANETVQVMPVCRFWRDNRIKKHNLFKKFPFLRLDGSMSPV